MIVFSSSRPIQFSKFSLYQKVSVLWVCIFVIGSLSFHMPPVLTHGEGIYFFCFYYSLGIVESLIKTRKNELDMISMYFCICWVNMCISLVWRVMASLGHNAIHLDSGQKSFLSFKDLLAQIPVLNHGNKYKLVLWHVIYWITLGKDIKY